MIRRILIVDDEPPARENLVYLLGETEPEAQIFESDNSVEAARLVGEMQPQVIFLDIQMPGLDGLQFLHFLPAETRPVAVFVTAHRQFAAEAFDLEAVDYLVKPFSRERFEQTLERVKKQLWVRQHRVPNTPAAHENNGRLCIKDGNHYRFVAIEAVDWVAAAGNYVEVHSGADSFLMRATMREMQHLLPYPQFVRIHRSILLNRMRIREIAATDSGDYRVHLQSGHQLAMSRRRKHALSQLLGKSG